MDKKQSFKQDFTLFIRYMLTYVIVCVVFLALLVPIYQTAREITRKKIIDQSYGKLESGVAELDNQIRKMVEMANMVRANPDFTRLARITGEPDVKDYYTIRQALSTLMDISSLHTIPQRSFVLFRKNPILISPNKSSHDFSSFYGKFLNFEGFLEKQFTEEIFKEQSLIQYLPETCVNYMGEEEFEGISCIVKIPVTNVNSFDSAMVFLLKKEELLHTLGPENQDGFIYLLDDRGQALFSENYPGKEYLEVSIGEIQNTLVEGINYTVLASQSQDSHLLVVVGIPEAIFHDEVASILRIIVIYIWIAVVSAAVICIWFTVKRFRQAKELLSVLFTSGQYSGKGDEYSLFKSAFLEVNQKKDAYERELSIMQGAIRNSMLEKLFTKGVYSRAEMEEIRELIGFSLDFYCVISVNISFNREEADTCQNIFYRLCHFMEKALKRKVLAVNASTTETIILVPFEPEDKPSTGRLSAMLSEIAGLIKEEYDLDISVGISNIATDLFNIHTCYLQAKTAARQIPEHTIVNSYSFQQNGSYLVDFNLGQQLYELVMAGEEEGVALLFEKLKKQISRQVFESEEDIMQLFFTVRNSLYNVSKDIAKGQHREELPNYNPNGSIRELLEQLHQVANGFCRQVIEKRKSSNEELKETILKYIQENYRNDAICAAVIADVCQISEKYLYHFIKEQTGKTLGEYIENLRMEEIKRNMLSTEEPVQDIAKAAGFTSVNTFYKAFKRVYGTAPGKWREQNKKR